MSAPFERFFNTAGPVVPAHHYCIPPLERLDLGDVLRLARQQRYFVLHAPRQTGKTSSLLALRDLLNESGEFRCLYANVEAGQTARDDVERGMRAILNELRIRALTTLPESGLTDLVHGALDDAGPHGALREVCTRWSLADPKPLILFLDEIDALVGDTLISVLRQLRSGYDERPRAFPQSVILCGVRDVRDYRIRSGSTGEIIAGGSPFNIKAKSLRVGDFSVEEVGRLLRGHTEATGQRFADGAVEAVWRQTQGQPWLVNALAQEACFENRAGRDRSVTIAEGAILEAQEALILGRQTHLHQLAFKLEEPRVRRVIAPILSGGEMTGARADDIEYVRDLGMIALAGPLRIANPIYREVIPRELTHGDQALIAQRTDWYVQPDGALDLDGLLAAFQGFFREHSEHWIERFEYKEAGPQLLLQAFLQRIVNRTGRIEREYGLGRRRTDLLVFWPPVPDGAQSSGAASEADRPMTRHVIECKIRRGALDAEIAKGLEQTASYMDKSAADTGHLVLFDPDPDTSWEEKLYRRNETIGSRRVAVWGA